MKPPIGGSDQIAPADEKEPLSLIIEELNERFGTEFTDEDRVFIEELENRLVQHPGLEASVRANTAENARLTFDHVVGDLLQDMVETNFELYKRVTDDPNFGLFFKDLLYGRYRDNVEKTPPGPKKPSLVDAVVEALVEEMAPQKLILFGSGASGEMSAESDLDLLVVMDEVTDQHSEMVRAYDALRGLEDRPPVDILVYSRADVDEWGDVVGHIINEALIEGRVLYDAA